jgi:hypothetical protein
VSRATSAAEASSTNIRKSTIRKLAAALDKIEAIRESGFPHHDSVDALDHIKGIFSNYRDEINNVETAADSVQKTFCRRAVEDIDIYLPIIGFIARSADLDGPVELHGPLLDLTKRALNDNAKLIMASEWDYSPLTILFPALSNLDYVLVGLPACEANNALLTPLAGHEIGHNIWEANSLRVKLQEQIKDAIVKTILEIKPRFVGDEISSDETRLRDLVGEQSWAQCEKWLRRQCEEAYCDLIGLLIFRESFLHAMEYLLTPTLTGERAAEYPSIKNRTQMLVAACGKQSPSIVVPDDYAGRFDAEKAPPSDQEQLLLTDQAFKKMEGVLYEEAVQVVTPDNLGRHSREGVEQILASFRLVVPATGARSLCDIVNAAWLVHLNPKNFLTEAYPFAKTEDAEMILNELVLKSFEVFEIERKAKVHDS